MKFRALALGAAIGFVAALVPSCQKTACGPSNCAGCCDSTGACVKTPNNGNNTTCGASGNACIDCTKTTMTCNSQCKCASGGTGGGAGGGGGSGSCSPSNCTGCCAGNTCIPLTAETATNCGKSG